MTRAVWSWVLVAAGACREPDPRPPVPMLPKPAYSPAPFDLGPPGAPRLPLADAFTEIEVPPHNLGEAGLSGGRYPLSEGWSQDALTLVWTHPSPIALGQPRYRAAPPGIALLRGQVELPYTPRTERGAIVLNGWEFYDGSIYLSATRDPATWPEPPVLLDQGAAERERRLHFATSGLDLGAFVRARLEVDGITRDALLLPAPGRATARVRVAEGGRLRFGRAIVAGSAASPPARADFLVLVDGVEVWRGEGEAGAPWAEAEIDLAAWAGQEVALTLRTEPGPDPEGDVCAFASPEIVGAARPGARRVVLVGIDTLRVDHLGSAGHHRDTTPGLDQVAAQSVTFPTAWAPSPRTRPSFRSSTTGRWPLAAIEGPTIAEVLGPAGFATAGIVANVHLAPRLGFADGYDWWQYRETASAGEQVDAALAWLAAHETEDAFLFLHIMDPHVFYLAPEPFRDLFTRGLRQGQVPDRYNRWMVKEWDKQGKVDPSARAFMEARYDGEIANTDMELTRFVVALDALPGRTLLVLHSDHGEEFWDHGAFEHNHSLYDEVMRAVLWFRPPGGLPKGRTVEGPASIADIPPTLYDLLRLSPDAIPSLDGRSLGAVLRDETGPLLPDRGLPMGHMMFAPEHWGVVRNGHKYVLFTGTGEERLYDLRSDPDEDKDLAHELRRELPAWRQALSDATGWPVGEGWRIFLTGENQPFTIAFADPVDGAGVIDPEALLERRANLEWGEVPRALASDIATVELSADRLLVRVQPVPGATGIIWVQGPRTGTRARVEPDGIMARPGMIALGGAPARIRHGAVIVPADTEARRLASVRDADAIRGLRALGYVE